MTWKPRQLLRQLVTETGKVELNTSRLWINVYALLGAVGIILIYVAVGFGYVEALLGVPAGFGLVVAVLHLMAWRAQPDRKAEDLRGSLRSSAQGAMQQRSTMGAQFTRPMVAKVGNRTDDER